MEGRIMSNKKRVLSLFLVLMIAATAVPWSCVTVSSSYNGVLQFDTQGKFTVMQVTDIQDDESVATGTIELLNRALARYSPDLVVLTGDNVSGNTSKSEFLQSLDQFLAPFNNTGTKFAVTFGNHDDEGNLVISPYSKTEQYNYYRSKGGDNFIDHDVEALDGVGNGSIPIYPNGQTSGTPAFQVFLMDSGTYEDNGYSHPATNQIDYYITTNPSVPSLWFQHICVPETYDLLTQVPAGTPYSFTGSSNPWNGFTYALNSSLIDWESSGGTTPPQVFKEPPCPPDLSTYQKASHRSSPAYGSKTLYESWRDYGELKGAFFGHDHKNSFVGTTADGVTLGYCKAATLNSYNDGDPGVRVFEIDDGGTYTTKSVTLSGLMKEEGVFNTDDDIEGTLNVPQVIYVGAAGNSISKQEAGNTIQLQTLNYTTCAMREADLLIDFDLPGAANVSLSAQGGAVLTQTSASNPYQWKITGGTGTAGSVMSYTLTYTLGGNTHTRKAYSYIDNIISPAGYMVYTRNYRGASSNSDSYTDVNYTLSVIGEQNGVYNIYGRSREHTVDYYEVATSSYTPYNELNPVDKYGYYNWAGTSDSAFVDKSGDTNHLFYGMNYYSPSRARLSCDWTRNVAAGKSPVATVYVDTSRVNSINDLGITLAFYSHRDTQNDNVMHIGVGLKPGDASYSAANWNTAYQANEVRTSIGSGEVTLGRTRGAMRNITLVGNKLPTTGDGLTVIPRVWAFNDDSGDNYNYTYTPVYMEFFTYSKAFLRAKVNEVRLSNIETQYASHVAFPAFEVAYREAFKQLFKQNTTQPDIDAALQGLENAIDQLYYQMDNISDNSAAAGNITVPEVLYVGAADNSADKQEKGTTIQTQMLNYDTKTMAAANRTVTFNLPGASGVSLSAVRSTGTPVTATQTSSTNPYSWEISGTAVEGEYIRYTVTYTLGGRQYTAYGASYVDRIPTPSGYFTFTRTRRNLVDAGNTKYWAESKTVTTVTGKGVYGGWGKWSCPDNGGNANGAIGYYRYASGTEDAGFATMVTTESDIANQYGLFYWSPSRYNTDSWVQGLGNNDSPYDDPVNRRAASHVYIDTRKASNLSAINMKLNIWQHSGHTYNMPEYFRSIGMYSGDATYSLWGTGTVPNTAGWSYALASGSPTMAYRGEYANYQFSGAVPADGSTYTLALQMYSESYENNRRASTYTGYRLHFHVFDTTALNSLVQEELAMFRQLSDGYSNANGKWTAYVNALVAAMAELNRPNTSATEVETVRANLLTAISQLEYAPADYTAVNNAIAAARVIHTGLTYYRANNINDPAYYNPSSTTVGDGVYVPEAFIGNANELMNAISSVVFGLDIRYQSAINAYAATIMNEWQSLNLRNADYTQVNQNMSYTDGATILAPPFYVATHAGRWLTREYYTSATLAAWDAACAAVVYGLKIPSQGTVDTYASSLLTAYQALRVKSDISYTVEYKSGGVSIAADKVVGGNLAGTKVIESYLSIPGYTYIPETGDEEGKRSMLLALTGNVMTFHYSVNTDVAYRVEHYRQTPALNDYALFETENYTGTTGSFVSAAPKAYTGFTYNPGISGTVTSGVIAGDGSLVLKLYYLRNSYTLTLNPQGGTVAPSTMTITYGTPYGNLPTPVKAGYTFGGWYTGIGGTGTLIENTTTVTVTAPQALYAKWNANNYTVVYDGNGSTQGSTANSAHVYDQAANITGNGYSRAGHSFLGWSTIKTAASPEYNDGQSVMNLTTAPGGVVTFYAVWSANTYQLVFNANGAGGTMAPQSIVFGKTAALNANTFTIPGHTFQGWATSQANADAGTVSYADGQNYTMNTTGAALYAVFAINSYSVTFNANGGTGSAPPVTQDYGTAIALPSTGFSKEGHTFIGWNTSASASTAFTNFTIPAGNTVLYAIYSVNQYTITFDANGGDGGTSGLMDYGVSLIPPAVTRAGYTFAGWSPMVPGIVPAQNATYTAQWILNSYTITFDPNGGNGGATIYAAYGSPLNAPAVVRNGYTFAGWLPELPATVPPANTTYVAQWTANQYTVTFDANGGDGYALPITQAFETVVTLPTAGFTKTGHTFIGWNTAPDAHTAMETFVMPAADTELYAVYRINQYTVTFNANGGSGSAAPITGDFGTVVTLPGGFTKTGFNFLGFSKNPDASAPAYTTSYTMEAANVTLYAVWVASDADYSAVVAAITLAQSATLPANAAHDPDYLPGGSLYEPAEFTNGGYYPRAMFTPASLTAMDNAVNAVVWGLDSSRQSMVDSFAAAIMSRYNDLELAVADYSRLNSLMDTVDNLDRNLYTSDSLDYVDQTMGYAYDTVAAQYKKPVEEWVEGVADILESALASLVYKPADYTIVYNAWNSKPANLYSDFTPASVAALVSFYEQQIQWNLTLENDGQQTVNGYAATIYELIGELELKPADYTAVDNALKSIPDNDGGQIDLDYTYLYLLYSNSSVADLASAVNTVVRGKDITEQSIVNGYAAGITAAVNALVPLLADYSALSAVLEIEPEWPDSYYTAASLTAYQNACAAGQLLIEAHNLGILQQQIVDDAVALIQTTLSALTLKAVTYTVKYRDTGGSLLLADETFNATAADLVTRNAVPVTGYTPLDESLQRRLSGSNSENIFVFVYSINSYTISFDLNGGTGTAPESQLCVFGASAVLPAQGDFGREHYDFLGWAEEPEATQPLGEFPMPAGDRTLYAVWSRVPVTLEALAGSTGVVDEANGFIYGLGFGLTTAIYEAQYLDIVGDGSLVFTPTPLGPGTGTKVELIDNVTGEVLKTYTIVIYGDVNGDSRADAIDADLCVGVQDWVIVWDPVADACYYEAADLNGNGRVESLDADTITAVYDWVLAIDQATGTVS